MTRTPDAPPTDDFLVTAEATETNVVTLGGDVYVPPEDVPTQEDVVTELEELLEMARAGELVGLAYVGQMKTIKTAWNSVGMMSPMASLGGLKMVEQRLLQSTIMDEGI